jgi:6-phosphogluconolactonase
VNGVLRLVESVPAAFADLVADGIHASGASGYSLMLSGGGTAAACYRALAARDGVAWTGVDVFLGDERCVPPGDPDSNHRMVTETLLDRIGPVRSDHPMYSSGPPGAAADAYQALLAALPRPDLVHLGLGPDGHCASLFPGSAILDDTDPDHLVVADRDPSGTNPHDRITLTYSGIARAKRIVVTVSGPSKRDALARIRSGEDLPAGRVTGDDILWLADSDALGDLAPDEFG